MSTPVGNSALGTSSTSCWSRSSSQSFGSHQRTNSGGGWIAVDASWQVEAFSELLLLLSAKVASRDSRKQIQRQVKVLLEDCTSEELNNVLVSGDMEAFLKLAGTDALHVVRKRLGELSVRCRALMLQDFYAVGSTMSLSKRQAWAIFVRDVFQSAKGLELTILKNVLDSGGSWNNLFKLVYEDLPRLVGTKVQTEILAHIRSEAAFARRSKAAGGPRGRLKIISDLDDTVWSSGGRFPAGCDRKYPAHTFYPGICALYKEVTRGPVELPAELANEITALRSSFSVPNGTKEGKHTRDGRDGRDGAVGKDRLGSKQRVTCQSHIHEHTVVAAECQLSDSIAEAWRKLSARAGKPIMDMSVQFGRSPDPQGQGQAHAHSHARAQGHDGTGGGLVSSEALDGRLVEHNLVMLSARPRVKAARGFFENLMYKKFQKMQRKGLLHSMPTLLPGSIAAGTKATILGAIGNFVPSLVGGMDNRIVWEAVAKKKYKDMLRYMELYPEYDFLFFGDDGQGDVQVAINALKNPKASILQGVAGEGARLTDVFIHRVKPRDKHGPPPGLCGSTNAGTGKIGTNESGSSGGRLSNSSRQGEQSPASSISGVKKSIAGGIFRLFSRRHERQHRDQMHFYLNSMDAAIVMYERDYISLEGLRHVTLQTCRDLLRMLRRGVYEHTQWRKAYGEGLIQEYQRSLEEVNEIMPDGMKLDDLPALEDVSHEGELQSHRDMVFHAPGAI